MKRQGYFKGGESVVCVLTGHGLKDPNIAISTVNAEPLVVSDTESAVMDAIAKLEGAHGYEFVPRCPGEGTGQYG